MILIAFIFLAGSSILLGLSRNNREGWKVLFFCLSLMSLAIALRWGTLYLQFCSTIFGKVLFIVSALIAVIVIALEKIKGESKTFAIIRVIVESVNLPILIGDYWIVLCMTIAKAIKWIKSC